MGPAQMTLSLQRIPRNFAAGKSIADHGSTNSNPPPGAALPACAYQLFSIRKSGTNLYFNDISATHLVLLLVLMPTFWPNVSIQLH